MTRARRRSKKREIPYDRIGFGVIGDSILRHLVIARVCHPQSKVATAAYLKSYFDEDVRLHNIYRYMDKLYNTQREKVQRISVEHTMRILGGRIGVVFYDVTTLYFESAPQPDDALRQAGFSKDGKMAEGERGRLPDVLLHLQRQPVRGAHDDPRNR